MICVGVHRVVMMPVIMIVAVVMTMIVMMMVVVMTTGLVFRQTADTRAEVVAKRALGHIRTGCCRTLPLDVVVMAFLG